MTLPTNFKNMRIPVIGSPLFIISGPELVIAQCKAGIVGSFPALNARPQKVLGEWLDQITNELAEYSAQNPERPAAPFAVNQIVHKSNDRLMEDLDDCIKYKVPIVITSLGAREDLNDAVHSYGGIVMQDIINIKYAKKALAKGADGLVAVCTGAGGHAGRLSPFSLIQEIREFFDGPLALSGSIANGNAVAAALALGADFAYIGSAFIACDEANAEQGYKDMVVDCVAEDIVYTNLITGVHGNYLAPSIKRAGLDIDNLPESDPSQMNFGSAGNNKPKAWKDIWGCGQGIGTIEQRMPVSKYVEQLEREYIAACKKIAQKVS